MKANGVADVGFDRRRINGLTVKVLRPAWRMRPDVRLLEVDGRFLVIKDYYRQANHFKRLLGQFLIQREYSAYQRLKNLHGIPRCIGLLDPWTLVSEQIPGQPAPLVDPERLDESFFGQLLNLVRQMHSRGVAHADVHNLLNILVDEYGRPALVDFTSAVLSGSNPVAALALPHLYEDDIKGIYKLKLRHRPDLLTDEESTFLHTRRMPERIFRFVRKFVRNPAKKLAAREQNSQ